MIHPHPSQYTNLQFKPIDGGFSHNTIEDMSDFLKFNNYDGVVVRVGNNAPCQINGEIYFKLDGKMNREDVYFVFDKGDREEALNPK